MENSPKIVIIGAGSLFFGRKLVWAVNKLEGLTNAHLAMVDTDPQHLEQMMKLAETVKAETGANIKITGSEDFRSQLPGADFVITSFSHRNAHYRGVDVQISAKHGVRMCSGDTIGPGGVFRFLREIPNVMEIDAAVAEICPKAWLINYINPSTVIGIALSRYGKTRGRNFALCDSLHLPWLRHSWLRQLGLDPEKDDPEFTLKIAGANHFTWMLEATLRGEDLMPQFIRSLQAAGREEPADAEAKALYNKRIAGALAPVFGAIPVCVAHTKEYLPYFQGYGAHVEEECVPPLSLFEHEKREVMTRKVWDAIAEFNSGEKPISEFLEKNGSDHATDIIQAIWNDSGRHFFVNLNNQGSVPNLPDDAFLELECVVDRQGPRPLPVGEMPLGLRALQMRVLDTHELTVEAYIKKDRQLLVRALAVDPIVNSLATAEALLTDLYAAQSDILEDWIAPPAASESAAQQAVPATGEALELGQTRIG
ncbi:MAG: glycoside hydrolase family 4 [Opitutales bacterium]